MLFISHLEQLISKILLNEIHIKTYLQAHALNQAIKIYIFTIKENNSTN